MGVGVYSENWRGTGGTFLVSGTLVGKAEYDDYVEQAEDPGDVMSFEEWIENESQGEYEQLIEAINRLHIAFKVGPLRPGYALSSDAMKEASDSYGSWRVFAEVDPYAIGVRSWQHDYVVGVAPQSVDQGVEVFADDGGATESECLDAYGAVLVQVREQSAALREALLELTRLAVQDAGFDCRFRTSGYTTGRYEPMDPEARKTRMAELTLTISDLRGWFAVGASDRLKASAFHPQQRKLLLSALRQMEDAGDRVDRRGVWPVVPCLELTSCPDGKRILVGKVFGALNGDIEFRRDLAFEGTPEFAALVPSQDAAERLLEDGPVSLDLGNEAERAVALKLVAADSGWFAVEPEDLLADWPEHARENWEIEPEAPSPTPP